jgi:hypothetical protein
VRRIHLEVQLILPFAMLYVGWHWIRGRGLRPPPSVEVAAARLAEIGEGDAQGGQAMGMSASLTSRG